MPRRRRTPWAVAAFALLLGLALLLAWISLESEPPPPSAVRPPRQTPERCSTSHPCLALVIDDIGRDLELLRELLALDAPLTFAVLPHARHTRPALALLQEQRAEHLVHLPMQPQDPSQVTDEPVVLAADKPLMPALVECLDRVPSAVGVNNHMGSALSERPAAMGEILWEVKRRGLWVLDSRTSAKTAICAVARTLQLPCRERDLFLDDPPVAATIKRRLATAVALAQQRGGAVGIAHPLQATLEVLRNFLAARHRIEIVPLSTLMSQPDAA